MKKTVYDVMQVPFGDAEHFPVRCIATAQTEQLARGVIARNNSGWHTFFIQPRELQR